MDINNGWVQLFIIISLVVGIRGAVLYYFGEFKCFKCKVWFPGRVTEKKDTTFRTTRTFICRNCQGEWERTFLRDDGRFM